MEKLHDKIAELCLSRFETLPKSGKPKPNEWTVLACIVLESEGNYRVVALGTGSKCIGQSKMCLNGDILNDSHAEVICRRSFLRFLYDRLKNGANFLHFDNVSKKFTVMEGVRFHFFTTHVPCGDAAIFPKNNVENFGKVIEQSDEYEVPRKVAKLEKGGDIFRTGAKCLPDDNKQDLKEPGAGFHVLGAVRTKPGRGDPTLSVSCSDKLSRWCHLGFQGALLSLLLKTPLYFSSFTLAAETPFSKDALERALYNRLGNVELKHPYRQHKPIIGQSSLVFSCGRNSTKQPSDCSVSWCDVEEKSLEVAVEGKKQGVTKKNLDKPSARLKICKAELLRSFLEVCELRSLGFGQNCNVKTFSYGEVKKLAVDYYECWARLRGSFKVWTEKDANLLHFSIK